MIELFPNSGHHYELIDLDFSKLADEKGARLLDSIKNGTNWIDHPHHRWVRYRFLKASGKQLLQIHVCIETNLGDVTRGSVLIPREPVAGRPWEEQNGSPYAYSDLTLIQKGATTSVSIPHIVGDEERVLGQFAICWAQPLGDPIDVDLVVDFGNSRTTALLLEHVPSAPGSIAENLIAMVKPVKFEQSDSNSHIIDSWFILKEPTFSNFEPPHSTVSRAIEELIPGTKKKLFGTERIVEASIKRVPQMFVELAPLAMGKAGQDALASADFRGGGIQFMSSPKRYAWDRYLDASRPQVAWTMTKSQMAPSTATGQNPKLCAQVLRFFPSTGDDWELSDCPVEWDPARRPVANPQMPCFPKADALSWMALAIIETAYRQINSPGHFKNNFPYIPRRLRRILVTHPSGWTGDELDAYRSKWNKAAYTFAYGHSASPLENAPTVEFPLDEAVAAQLPLIFSEIHKLNNIGDNWFELMGRPDSLVPGGYVARVMTVDIGGGTTDFSVVEYRDKAPGQGVHLELTLLFKDSSTIAGDVILKNIIEQAVLPSMKTAFEQNYGIQEDYGTKFDELFSHGLTASVSKEHWKRITRLVLMPIALQWLADISARRDPTSSVLVYPGTETFYRESEDAIKKLNDEAITFGIPHGVFGEVDQNGVVRPASLNVSKSTLEEIIGNSIKGMFEGLSKYVAAFDVDLVVVAGKPSELQKLKDVLTETLPISVERILFAKNFPIGNWYPFSTTGKIEDAKSVTAVGLALFQAIRMGRIPEWYIESKESMALTRHYWLQTSSMPGVPPRILLQPAETEAMVTLMPNTRISRRLLPSGLDPEPTYIFRWKNQSVMPPPSLSVTLKRVPSLENHSEKLEVVKVESTVPTHSASLDDISLDLCTLPADEHWIDQARFTVYDSGK